MRALKIPFWMLMAVVTFAAGSTPIRAVEPPAPFIRDFLIQGNSAISDSHLVSVLPINIGDSADPDTLRLVNDMTLSLFRNRGYMEATVDASYQIEGTSATVRIDVNEGDLYRYGKTTMSGLIPLPSHVVELEKTYREGDPFNRQELFNTQSRLFMTGFFEDISIEVSTTTQKTADISIRFTKRPMRWFKGGLGWGSEERERVTLSFLHENFLERAYRAEATILLSRIWLDYKLEVINPYFLKTRTEHRLSANWRSEDREGYDLETTIGRASWARELTPRTHGSLNYRLQQTVVFNVEPEIALTTPKRSEARVMGIALNRDTTNDPIFSTRGTRTHFILEHSGGVFGGNVDLNKALLEPRFYHTVTRGLVVAAAARVGIVEEFAPSREVPIFERFFTGGANSVRGYRERGVGPTDSEGSPLGAKRLAGANLELRFPVLWRFSGTLFLDGGMVADKYRHVEPSDWKYATGLGLRFRTPVGPFRLDYGWKLNPDLGDNDRWRVHFSLGESF